LSPQVRAEFKRVVSTDLLESFLDGLDDLAPRLLEVYEAATKSAKKPALKAILDCLKKDVSRPAENCKIGHQMFAIKSHCLVFFIVGHKRKEKDCCSAGSATLPKRRAIRHHQDV